MDGQEPSIEPHRLTFEAGDPGDPRPPDPWYLAGDSDIHQVSDQRASDGQLSYRLGTYQSSLAPSRIGVDVDLTEVARIRLDCYVEANHQSWGYLKVDIDGDDGTIVNFTGVETGQWHADAVGDVSEYAGEHTLYLRAEGDGNEGYFDNVRFFEEGGGLVPTDRVVIGSEPPDDPETETDTATPPPTTTRTPTPETPEPRTRTPTRTPTPSPPQTTEGSLSRRLRDAGTKARVQVEGDAYLVLSDIPDEPADRYAYATPGYSLLGPEAATDAAMAHTWQQAYDVDSRDRVTYTREQREQFDDVESMARTADILAELSGAIAVAKLDPLAAASNAVSAIGSAVDWAIDEATNPYREQFNRMAATGATVGWADSELPGVDGSLQRFSDGAIDVAQLMLNTAGAVTAYDDLGQATSTVRDVLSAADGVRDDVSGVDGVEDLRSNAYTALATTAVDAVVSGTTAIAEAQARSGALGGASAGARLPLLAEIVDLEERARQGRLGPAGILRLQCLRQTDYQIEAAAYTALAAYQDQLSSGLVGRGYDALFGTDRLAEQAAENAETWNQLSHLTMVLTGETFDRALGRYDRSLNRAEYGDQTLLTRQ